MDDGYRLEFTNPRDGGSIMTTISAFAQLIPAGFETRPVQSADGSVQIVVSGQETVEIGGGSVAASKSDIFAVPSRATLRIAASDPLVPFRFSDQAAPERLELGREQLG